MAEKRGARHFWQRKSSRGPGSGTRAGPKTTGAGMPAWWTSAVCGNFETAAGAAYYKVKEGKVFMTLLKRFAVTAVAGMVAGAMLCTSAAAVAVEANVVKDTNFTEKLAANTVIEFTDPCIKDGEQYVLLIAEGTLDGATAKVTVEIDSNKLTYIDQVAASGTTVTFDKVLPKMKPNSVVLLGGVFEGKESPIVIGFITSNGMVEIPPIPVTESDASTASDITFSWYDPNDMNNPVGSSNVGEEANIPAGVFTIQITRPGYLPLTITNYEAGDNITEQLSNFKKCAGNLNGDDVIDIVDIGVLIGKYDKEDPNAEDVCNLTKDGIIDILDIQVIIGNYDRRAEQMTMSAK